MHACPSCGAISAPDVWSATAARGLIPVLAFPVRWAEDLMTVAMLAARLPEQPGDADHPRRLALELLDDIEHKRTGSRWDSN